MAHISNDKANEYLENYLKKEYPHIIIDSSHSDLNNKIDKEKLLALFSDNEIKEYAKNN